MRVLTKWIRTEIQTLLELSNLMGRTYQLSVVARVSSEINSRCIMKSEILLVK